MSVSADRQSTHPPKNQTYSDTDFDAAWMNLTQPELESLAAILIDRFYSFDPHHCAWTWCYLIWLDQLSSSFPWTVADTAWENDLEPMEEAA